MVTRANQCRVQTRPCPVEEDTTNARPCASEFKFPLPTVTPDLSYLSVLILRPCLPKAGRRLGFPGEYMQHRLLSIVKPKS